MQISRCDLAKVPQEGAFRKDASSDRQNSSGIVPTEGRGTVGRQSNAGPYPHAVERSTQVQHRDDDGVFEGQECDPHPPGGAADERDVVWPSVLVTRLLREHSRIE